MTREELISEFSYNCECEVTTAKGNTTMCFMCLGVRVPKGSLEDVIVAAYNRAIEDVLELELLMPDEIENLEI